jgi:hypothetical protein
MNRKNLMAISNHEADWAGRTPKLSGSQTQIAIQLFYSHIRDRPPRRQ